LDDFHQNELKKSGVEYEVIGGNWGERFDRAVAFVAATFGVIYQAPPQYQALANPEKCLAAGGTKPKTIS
jgi:hypothetical protein